MTADDNTCPDNVYWSALKQIARARLMRRCEQMVEDGKTKAQVHAELDAMIPRTHAWMRSTYFRILDAMMSNDDAPTKH